MVAFQKFPKILLLVYSSPNLSKVWFLIGMYVYMYLLSLLVLNWDLLLLLVLCFETQGINWLLATLQILFILFWRPLQEQIHHLGNWTSLVCASEHTKSVCCVVPIRISVFLIVSCMYSTCSVSLMSTLLKSQFSCLWDAMKLHTCTCICNNHLSSFIWWTSRASYYKKNNGDTFD